MKLTVLSVAYPLATVGPDTVGGAEQILSALDRAIISAGQQSLVVASAGSQVAGTLIAVSRVGSDLQPRAVERARSRHRQAILSALEAWPVDVVHMHGVDFYRYLPPPGPPVLVTLHLPLSFYPSEALHPQRPATFLHCVSAAQHASAAGQVPLMPPIENGVVLAAPTRHHREDFALMLCRICPEKGVHIAIDAAKRAQIPLLIAGKVYAYPEHRRYFATEIRPRLDGLRRFIGPVRSDRKQHLLATARCLLVASSVPETSSLAAREALAAGTPVVALTSPALADLLEHGRTGFLVGSVQEMAKAIADAGTINPDACRAAARRFSLEQMANCYLERYRALANHPRASSRLLAS